METAVNPVVKDPNKSGDWSAVDNGQRIWREWEDGELVATYLAYNNKDCKGKHKFIFDEKAQQLGGRAVANCPKKAWYYPHHAVNPERSCIKWQRRDKKKSKNLNPKRNPKFFEDFFENGNKTQLEIKCVDDEKTISTQTYYYMTEVFRDKSMNAEIPVVQGPFNTKECKYCHDTIVPMEIATDPATDRIYLRVVFPKYLLPEKKFKFEVYKDPYHPHREIHNIKIWYKAPKEKEWHKWIYDNFHDWIFSSCKSYFGKKLDLNPELYVTEQNVTINREQCYDITHIAATSGGLKRIMFRLTFDQMLWTNRTSFQAIVYHFFPGDFVSYSKIKWKRTSSTPPMKNPETSAHLTFKAESDGNLPLKIVHVNGRRILTSKVSLVHSKVRVEQLLETGWAPLADCPLNSYLVSCQYFGDAKQFPRDSNSWTWCRDLSNLGPGSYMFRVIYTLSDGSQTPSQEYSFVIKPAAHGIQHKLLKGYNIGKLKTVE
jgi:hypothetical protein